MKRSFAGSQDPNAVPTQQQQQTNQRRPKRSCAECRNRHLKCDVVSSPESSGSGGGSGRLACQWCVDHGRECIYTDSSDTATSATAAARSRAAAAADRKPPSDGSIILNGGATSAFGGFQLSSQMSFLSADDPDARSVLHLRQTLQKERQAVEVLRGDGGGVVRQLLEEEEETEPLRLDPIVRTHLEDLYYKNVHPFLPIITRAYLASITPTPLLLSAMYGVAARTPGAIISFRDLAHIKRVLQRELNRLQADYKPSLQAVQALVLIHLRIELQCDSIDGVEVWPLRLAMGIRMGLQLRLHRKASYSQDPPELQETKRRLFWALFIKDRWTFTGKGYPLIIDLWDIDVDPPSPQDPSAPSHPPHSFFLELRHQALLLGHVHAVSFRADRFARVSLASFQHVENLLATSTPSTQNFNAIDLAHLTLNHAAIVLLFYAPFFLPATPSEAALFSTFLPNLPATRRHLAHTAVSALLTHASAELLPTGPSIWSITFYTQLRCFLVALSVMHDPIADYDSELRRSAEAAVRKGLGIAEKMVEERVWGFEFMSGNLLLFTKAVADGRMERARRVEEKIVVEQQQQQQQQEEEEEEEYGQQDQQMMREEEEEGEEVYTPPSPRLPPHPQQQQQPPPQQEMWDPTSNLRINALIDHSPTSSSSHTHHHHHQHQHHHNHHPSLPPSSSSHSHAPPPHQQYSQPPEAPLVAFENNASSWDLGTTYEQEFAWDDWERFCTEMYPTLFQEGVQMPGMPGQGMPPGGGGMPPGMGGGMGQMGPGGQASWRG